MNLCEYAHGLPRNVSERAIRRGPDGAESRSRHVLIDNRVSYERNDRRTRVSRSSPVA